MTTPTENLIVDRPALRDRLSRAIGRKDTGNSSHPLLARIEEDVIDRLATILRTFDKGVVLSPWPTSLGDELAKLERIGKVTGSRVLGGSHADAVDDEHLPFAPGSVDLIASVFSLQAINDLPGALIQARRALRADGLFLGVMFAGQTLTELRTCFLEAESMLTNGASPRVLPFADVRELGGLMQRAGFALPVADLDTVRVTYESPLELLRELRAYGATNVLLARSRYCMRRDVLMRAMELYSNRFSEANGRVVATIDLVTLTGWAPSPDQQQPLRPGSATQRLSDALGTAEHKLRDGE